MVRMPVTRVLYTISTPLSKQYSIRALAISHALPLLGNTRCPRSISSFTPLRSKKRIVALLLNSANATSKKSALTRIASLNSSGGRAFVRLHRPLPEILILRPAFSIFSIRSTCLPFRAAVAAAIMPAAPAPITMTSYIIRSKFSQMYKKYCNV